MINKIYLFFITIVFAGLVVVFVGFPRPKISELEKRELATFPEFSFERLFNGQFTDSVSSWFSDTEPYRDKFMEISMTEKDWMALKLGGEEAVTFHASNEGTPALESDPEPENIVTDPTDIEEYDNKLTANDKAKVANHGIIIVGSGAKARALMAFGGGKNGGVGYAEAANTFKKTFGPKVNIYCMVIPSAAAFYTPEKARSFTNEQLPVIKNIFAHLDKDVKAVDIYTTLGNHAAEDIYFRTDHHWSPLGAFYAAQKFAEVAGVPFKDLKSYERNVVHGFVGTMYGYSKDISIKKAPEDMVYYIPQNIEYTTTYIDYKINKDYQVTSESEPREGIFFHHFKDGSSSAYCTFMGGDTRLTVVRTGTKNGRRLIILKDSYGNALPGYLFYSFEEIHVIDGRYFTKNLKNYVHENKITDILFANNIFKAYGKTYKSYLHFLEMPDNTHVVKSKKSDKKSDKKTDKKDSKKTETKSNDKKSSSDKKTDKKEASSGDSKTSAESSTSKDETPSVKKTSEKKTTKKSAEKKSSEKKSSEKKSSKKSSKKKSSKSSKKS